MTRCEVTELPKAWCAHCTMPDAPTPPDPFASPEPARGPWFNAGYDGQCSNCGGYFEAGDEIRADGEGGWECCGGAA